MQYPFFYVPVISDCSFEKEISPEAVHRGPGCNEFHVGCGDEHLVRIHRRDFLSAECPCAYSHNSLTEHWILRDFQD